MDWIKGTGSGGGNGDDENDPGTPANRGAIIGDQRDEDCPICTVALTKFTAEVRKI